MNMRKEVLKKLEKIGRTVAPFNLQQLIQEQFPELTFDAKEVTSLYHRSYHYKSLINKGWYRGHIGLSLNERNTLIKLWLYEFYVVKAIPKNKFESLKSMLQSTDPENRELAITIMERWYPSYVVCAKRYYKQKL